MARVKLTAGRVAEFTTENGQAFLWDSEVPGLALRATSSGNKAYIFQSRIDGKTPRMTICDTRAWSIDDARNKARDWQKQIDNGQDPRKVIADNKASEQAKEKSKQDAIEAATEQSRKENVTVLEAWADYVTDASAKWSERHQQFSI